MNYIQQIRAFDDFRLYKSKLSSGQVALWYSLMSINNKTSWQTWFTAANATLESLSGLSRSGIAKDRNALKQLGLIDFKSNGRQATSYHVCVLYTSDSVQGSTQDSTQGSTQHSVQRSGTLNKLNETKQEDEDDDARANVIDDWSDLWGFPNAVARPELDEMIDQLGPELVAYAIKVAGDHQVKSYGALSYVRAVIEGWKQLKITTVAQAKKANKEHEQRRRSNQRMPEASTEPRTRKDWVG